MSEDRRIYWTEVSDPQKIYKPPLRWRLVGWLLTVAWRLKLWNPRQFRRMR